MPRERDLEELTAGTARIYFAGDNAYTPLFHDVRRRLGPLDLALLPIGACEPRWFMRSVHSARPGVPDESGAARAVSHVRLR